MVLDKVDLHVLVLAEGKELQQQYEVLSALLDEVEVRIVLGKSKQLDAVLKSSESLSHENFDDLLSVSLESLLQLLIQSV